MAISAKEVKALRESTGAGMMDCKKALTEAEGNVERAVELLRKKGMAKAAKRAGRATSEGLVQSYIHGNGKIGVLIELNCETDFVAKTDDFVALAKDLCMQIAAVNPAYVSRESVPAEIVEKEMNLYKEQALESGKPEKIVEKIATGKLEKFFSEVCLVDQAFVKEDKKKVSDRVQEAIGKLGEHISVARFVRYQIGK